MRIDDDNDQVGHLVKVQGGRVHPDILAQELANRRFPQTAPSLPAKDAALKEALDLVKAEHFPRQRIEVKKYKKVIGLYKLDSTDEKIPGFCSDSITCSFQNETLVIENATPEIEAHIQLAYLDAATTINSAKLHQLTVRVIEALGGENTDFGYYMRPDGMGRFRAYVEAIQAAAVSSAETPRFASMVLRRDEETIATLTSNLQEAAMAQLNEINDAAVDGNLTPQKLENRLNALRDVEGKIAYYENLLQTAWASARAKLEQVSDALAAAQAYQY